MNVSNLRVFFWNDHVDELDKWKEVLKKCGFVDCAGSRFLESSDVAKACFDFEPDLVVVDVKAPTQSQLGLKIANAIRQFDSLVPIIAVTKAPDELYDPDYLAKISFAGIFEQSVMTAQKFVEIAVRPSLNYWHLLAPEHALVRKGMLAIRKRITGVDSHVVDSLCEAIGILPFTGISESWHQQVVMRLSKLIDGQGHKMVAARFQKLARVFEEADPYYMAGSNSRRHLSHNVQVFLLGLFALLELEPVRRAAIKDLKQTRLGISDGDALLDAVLIWACIANTHDVGYLRERFVDVVTKLKTVVTSLTESESPLPPSPFLPDKDFEEWKKNWPSVYHGDIASRLWLKDRPIQEYQESYFQRIADAIRRHDSNHFPGSPVLVDLWAQFLAVLTDELQDWNRERLEAPPGAEFKSKSWSLFALENIEVSKKVEDFSGANAASGDDSSWWQLSLYFVARDHPETAAAYYGSDGVPSVDSVARRIKEKIESNLRSPIQIRVSMQTAFVSRNIQPKMTIATIPREV